jgi:hypothetical protein
MLHMCLKATATQAARCLNGWYKFELARTYD